MRRMLAIILTLLAVTLLASACGDAKDSAKDKALKDADKAVADASKQTDEAMKQADQAVADAKKAIAQGPRSVQLVPVKGSGVSGVAVFQDAGGKTSVSLALTGDDGKVHPAHIHKGTCDNPDKAPLYPLTNVDKSVSKTTVDVKIEDLAKEPLLVNVHKSPDDLATYISCGNIEFVGDAAVDEVDQVVKNAGLQSEQAMKDAEQMIEDAK